MLPSSVEAEFSVHFTRNFTSSWGFIHRHPSNEVGGGEWQLVTAIPEWRHGVILHDWHSQGKGRTDSCCACFWFGGNWHNLFA
jgi:hypothetical protein